MSEIQERVKLCFKKTVKINNMLCEIVNGAP